RTARTSAAKAVEGSGRSANRIGNAGSAREADGMRERMRRAVVTNRTGRFGNRTRRITRTWDVIKTKNVYTIRRVKSGRAATAGRPVVTAMPTAATAAESPPAPSRLTSWKSRSATRYSRGRTSAVRKKSNSDAWAVTPAPRAYSRPKDRRPASGAPTPRGFHDRHGGFLRQPQEDVFEAPLFPGLRLGAEGREVAGRDVPSMAHDRHAPAEALRRVELVRRDEDGGAGVGHRREALF